MTLQDCGQVLPGATLIVIKVENPQPQICKTDEVGEICMASGSSGSSYWGLPGLTNQTFKIRVTDDNSPALDQDFVRSGLLGFLGTSLSYKCLSPVLLKSSSLLAQKPYIFDQFKFLLWCLAYIF